jgi:hypothetical protein
LKAIVRHPGTTSFALPGVGIEIPQPNMFLVRIGDFPNADVLVKDWHIIKFAIV